jgi:hypothetical protein
MPRQFAGYDARSCENCTEKFMRRKRWGDLTVARMRKPVRDETANTIQVRRRIIES